jgi:hypothetical protein
LEICVRGMIGSGAGAQHLLRRPTNC